MNKRSFARIEYAGVNRYGHLLVTVFWVTLVPNMASIRFIAGMYDQTPVVVPITETEPLAFSSQAALERWTKEHA